MYYLLPEDASGERFMIKCPPSSQVSYFLRTAQIKTSVILLLVLISISSSLHAGIFEMKQTKGRFVRIEMPGKKKTLSFSEIQVFSGGKNVALSKLTEMSSQFSQIAKYSPGVAVDMSTDRSTGVRTKLEENPWWVVDLGKSYSIDKIVIYRSAKSLKGITVKIGNQKDCTDTSYTQLVSTDANVIGFMSDAISKKNLGAIWLIGDQVTLGDQDDDASSSPRSTLYNSLKANDYRFSFTGHSTSASDGLPNQPEYSSHSAFSGANIADVSNQLNEIWNKGRLKTVKPKYVCIMLGTNDIHNDLIDGTPQRLKTLIEKVYALPGIGKPVLLVASIPPNQTIERRKTNVNIFNEAIEGLVAEFQMTGKEIHFVDHFNALGGENTNQIANYMLADKQSENGVGVNVSARGNAVIGAKWFNAIEVPLLTADTDTEPWVFPKAISVRSVVKHAPAYRQYIVNIPGGGQCTIIPPRQGIVHKSGKKPWFWRNIFYSSNTGQSIKTDLKLIDEGYYSVNVYGSVVGHPRGNKRVKAVYDYLTKEHGFAPTFSASAMSRGGFMVIRYANEYPDQIEGILMDNACSNGLGWPAGKPYAGHIEYAPGKTYSGPGSKSSFELYVKEYEEFTTLEQATEFLKTNSPIHQLEPLAKSGVPILSICGSKDHAVIYEENDKILESTYKKLGGDIEVIIEDKGHKHGQIGRDVKNKFYEFVRKNTFRVPKR
jgi:lysophospholipase L1-like esterase